MAESPPSATDKKRSWYDKAWVDYAINAMVIGAVALVIYAVVVAVKMRKQASALSDKLDILTAQVTQAGADGVQASRSIVSNFSNIQSGRIMQPDAAGNIPCQAVEDSCAQLAQTTVDEVDHVRKTLSTASSATTIGSIMTCNSALVNCLERLTLIDQQLSGYSRESKLAILRLDTSDYRSVVKTLRRELDELARACIEQLNNKCG